MTSGHHTILLVSVNARYSHCSFAARTLIANLENLSENAGILESDLAVTALQLSTLIAERRPRIVGFTAYLWNIRLIENTARILRAAAPQLRLAVGGPEITEHYPSASLFDAVIVGEGESAFRAFCERSLSPPSDPRPPTAVSRTSPEDTASLTLPYHLYSDHDIAQRTVYVEASRGCPYACTYCTSAGTGLRLIPLDRLLPALETLWQRGLRHFKFLDRSFNAPLQHANAILDFFLPRATPDLRLHFEINPDHLHASVAERIAAYPNGVLHLEAGIQTLNPQVAAAVGRCPETDRTLETLQFLTQRTGAVVHADLIFGLPGETLDSFIRGFNTLVERCAPPELQVNLLKGLPGTRLAGQAESFGLVFNPEPPYEVLRTDVMDFATLMRLQRFARCWELVYNRNRFPHAVRRLHALSAPNVYRAYERLADRIHADEGKLFAISLTRLSHYLRASLVEDWALAPEEADRLIAADLGGKP